MQLALNTKFEGGAHELMQMKKELCIFITHSVAAIFGMGKCVRLQIKLVNYSVRSIKDGQ